jgi:hypothetical protein
MNAVEKDWITVCGLRAVVIRTSIGHRCGFVGITSKHPLFGTTYGQHSDVLKEAYDKVMAKPLGKRGIMTILCMDGRCSPEIVFDVHGSITYSGGCKDYPTDWNEKHPDERLWWYGFDCAHAGDNDDGGRSLEYVEGECESLARQLAVYARIEEEHTGNIPGHKGKTKGGRGMNRTKSRVRNGRGTVELVRED